MKMDPEPQKENLEAILCALRDEQAMVREQAIEHLEIYANSVGNEAHNGTLTEAEALKAWDRARIQRLQDSRIVAALLVAIDDPSARLRAKTALLLGHAEIPEAQEALLQHLQSDPEKQVRMMCVWGLRYLPDSAQKTQGFISALHDPHYQVVFPACKSLGEIGEPQAIEPLRAVLSHSYWGVRFRACEALVRLKAVDLYVVNLLEELIGQPETQQHNEIVQKVNELNAPEAQAQTVQAVLDQARRLLNP
jgi:HEAT repeat protein